MSKIFETDMGVVNPFFAASGLTEDQLIAKMSEVDKKIAAANRAGASFEVMDQLWAIREMLSKEFTERSLKRFSDDKGKDDFDNYLSIG
jgi:hypothetical protein